MKTITLIRGLTAGTALLLLAVLVSGPAQAYPPAPHHTLYGMVRNEWGDPLDFSSAEVYIEATNNVTVRAVVASSTEPGVNYRLEVPMDAGTTLDLYAPTVMRRNQSFRLKVKIGQTTYLPMEMRLSPAGLGQPAQSTRLDLTLGEDSDGDGLPDAWEQALIAIYGGTLESIRPNDDLDGDGISNLNEYLAGTYAFDPNDGFVLKYLGANAGTSTLQFMAIRGRTYTIEASTDLQQNWAPTPFRLNDSGPGGALLDNYEATNTVLLQIQVPPDAAASSRRFFRAKVQ